MVPGMLERPWPDAQADLVRDLLQPAAYGHAPATVTHLETHISHVFIAGEFAYKVKKAVNLGFLDYSTPALRRAACEEELRVNRRLAPDLYLAVVPIAAADGGARVEGAGAVLEFAVKMRAFAQQALLDAVLARGELGSATIDRLAWDLADFHRSLDPAPLAGGHGSAEAVSAAALQNFDQLAPLVHDAAVSVRLTALRDWTAREARRLHARFESRRRDGYVRECHGDLHLGNIALWKDRPLVFDAIEFSADLRWIDVLSEIAFLVMDLDFHRRRDLAFRFLNQYLERTGDYAGLPVLRFYLVYRALVRAKVLALRAASPDVSERRRQTLNADRDAHLLWAQDLTRREAPVIIILHGFSGAGKTSRSMTVLQTLGGVRMRSDVERKRLHALDPLARGRHGVRQGLYSEPVSDETYAHLERLTEAVARAGFPAIVDAAFLRSAQRQRFRDLARRLGVPFVIADFLASPEVLRTRVAARTAAGSDASDADLAVLDHQLRHAEPLSDEECARTVCFDTERCTQDDVRQLARRLLHAARVD